MALRLALVSLAALAAGTAAHGQATSIVPDTAPGVSLGTTVANGGGPVTTIDGGTLAGTNLFHSFSTFNLGTGDIAQWVHSAGNEASITNVVNRVTGGTPSTILGMLDSTAIPNADFYFVNPAGLVFGTGAQVNVPAAAHFSTASELRFHNGETLSVAAPNGATLSVAAPRAFGFLGGEGDAQFTDITNDVQTFLPGGREFSISAANISMDNAFIGSRGLAIAAVGDQPFDVPVFTTPTLDAGGRVELINSWLQTWPGDCFDSCLGNSGYVMVLGGQIYLDTTGITAELDSEVPVAGTNFISLLARDTVTAFDSSILSDSYGAADAGAVYVMAGTGIDMVGTMVLTYTDGTGRAGYIYFDAPEIALAASSLESDSYDAGNAGRIDVFADTLELSAQSDISSNAYSVGQGGDINVTAADVALYDFSSISSDTYDVGDAGNVSLFVDTLSLVSSSNLSSDALGSGNGGTIFIDATGAVAMADMSTITSSAGFPDGSSIGNAGDIVIHAESLSLDTGSVGSNSGGRGTAGSVTLDIAGDLWLTRGGITSQASGPGDAGSITIAAANAYLDNGGSISSDSQISEGGQVALVVDGLLDMGAASRISTGAQTNIVEGVDPHSAGDISIVAGELAMDGALIGSVASGLNEGGIVGVEVAGDVTLANSVISASSFGLGDAGVVLLYADGAVSLTGESFLASDTYGEGNAGGTVVEAGDISLDGGSYISSDAVDRGDSGITFVTARGTLSVSDAAFISSDTYGEGNSGGTFIVADELQLNGGFISSDAYGRGDAGTVTVDVAGALRMDAQAYISSDTLESGSGGEVFVTAGSAHLAGDSFISSDAYGDGDGGFVDVKIAGALTLDSGARISTNVQGAGWGGAVFVEAGSVDLSGGSAISSKSFVGASGNAGDVDIEADRITLVSSAISSEAMGSGDGGFVAITSDELDMSGGSTVTTSSANANPSGLISLEVGALTMTDIGTEVASINSNLEPGDNEAGAILIATSGATISDGARVTTNSATGIAGLISFEMAPDSILILSGEDLPGILETSSGPGKGGIISISRPLAIISDFASILALGNSGGANVQIDTPYFITSSDRLNRVEVDGELAFSNSIYDVSAGTVDTDLSMLDASGVLRGQCSAVRSNGGASVLNIRPAGPFGTSGWSDVLPRRGGTGASGGCP